MYLLGYLASQSRVYLMDKDFGVVPYTLLLSVVEYKTLVLRGDLETAAEVLETIPKVGGQGRAGRQRRCVLLLSRRAHAAAVHRARGGRTGWAAGVRGAAATAPGAGFRWGRKLGWVWWQGGRLLSVRLGLAARGRLRGALTVCPVPPVPPRRTSTTASPSSWRPRACRRQRWRWPQTRVRPRPPAALLSNICGRTPACPSPSPAAPLLREEGGCTRALLARLPTS